MNKNIYFFKHAMSLSYYIICLQEASYIFKRKDGSMFSILDCYNTYMADLKAGKHDIFTKLAERDLDQLTPVWQERAKQVETARKITSSFYRKV